MQKVDGRNSLSPANQLGHRPPVPAMSTYSAPAQSPPETFTSPPISIILTVILLLLFFAGFFSIYFFRCFFDGVASSWHRRSNPSGTPVGPSGSAGNPGLDPSIIESFPKFAYSAVKGFRKGKDGLECAICLSEFEDDDFLRLLTICCHVFHQECIDLWLQSHKTCPVCRRSLDAPESLRRKCALIDEMHEHEESDQSGEGSLRIVIKEDGQGGRGGSGEGAASETDGHSEEHNRAEKFSRSHSTGHSIVRITDDHEKYTLRLPEHVKEEFARPRHNGTRSWTTYGGYPSNAGTRKVGFGEASGYSGGDINKV